MRDSVGCEDVIEGAVLADQYDDVFDGSPGVLFLPGLQLGFEWTAQTELGDGQRDESDAHTVQEFRKLLLLEP